MASDLSRLEYTQKDFATIRAELVNRIPQITDRWTDFNTSDIGITLLTLFTGLADMLLFYLDNEANESFLPTARQRKNVMALVKLIDYRLSHITSSTADLSFTLAALHPAAIAIPRYTVVSSAAPDSVKFVVVKDFQIPANWPAGIPFSPVGVRQGELQTHTVTGTNQSGQVYPLPHTDVAEGSVEVFVDGDEWTSRKSFVSSEAPDTDFVVETDHLDVTRVFFGGDGFGKPPPDGSDIQIKYLRSKGANGNIGANKITILESTLLDVDGNSPPGISIINSQPATGGASKESIEDAKRRAPAALSALDRMVTKGDHIALMEAWPGVARAQAWGEQEENPPNFQMYNVVRYTFIPEGGGQPSDVLKTEIADLAEAKKVITTRMEFIDPVYIPVDVTATIYVEQDYDPNTVRAEVEASIKEFFDFDNKTFDVNVRRSNIVRILDAHLGVHHVSVTEPSADIIIGRHEIATLGSLTINPTLAWSDIE